MEAAHENTLSLKDQGTTTVVKLDVRTQSQPGTTRSGPVNRVRPCYRCGNTAIQAIPSMFVNSGKLHVTAMEKKATSVECVEARELPLGLNGLEPKTSCPKDALEEAILHVGAKPSYLYGWC